MKIGDKESSFKIISKEDITVFAEIVGDSNPIHIDKEFAANTIFNEPIAQGMLIGSLISGVLGTKLPGPGCIYLKQTLQFVRPVKVNDCITALVEVTDIKTRNDSAIVTLDTGCFNQFEEPVVIGEAVMKVFL